MELEEKRKQKENKKQEGKGEEEEEREGGESKGGEDQGAWELRRREGRREGEIYCILWPSYHLVKNNIYLVIIK